MVAEVKNRGLFDRVYVYGFDEDGPECEPGVRKLFGGLKERFPGLRTASTLRFGDISEMGLPLDILICHIRFHNETAAQRQSARDAAIKAAKAELAKRKGKKGGARKGGKKR